MSKTIIFMIYYLGQCGCGFSREVARKIELKETQTLDDFHEAIIIQSFGWDDPHMYSFHFDNIPYSKNRSKEYSCDPEPDMYNGAKPNSTKAKLKGLSLKKNQKFKEFLQSADFDQERVIKIIKEIEDKIKCPNGGHCFNILKQNF